MLGPVTIGEHAVIGAQALVNKDVPPGARVLAATAVIKAVGQEPQPMEDLYAVTASAKLLVAGAPTAGPRSAAVRTDL